MGVAARRGGGQAVARQRGGAGARQGGGEEVSAGAAHPGGEAGAPQVRFPLPLRLISCMGASRGGQGTIR